MFSISKISSIKTYVPIGLLTFAALFSGCDSNVNLPAPRGPFKTGIYNAPLTDPLRKEIWDESNPNSPRKIMVTFYYPTLQDGPGLDLKVAPYSLQPDGGGIPIKITAHTNSVENAAPASGLMGLPALVLSHGMGITRLDYIAFAEELASRGYIVAALDHTYMTREVEFPDGTIVKSNNEESGKRWVDPATLSILTGDMALVLDYLENAAGNPEHMFFERINMDTIGAMGHSMGGAISAAAMETDPRIKAAVNMDGTFSGPIVETGTQNPLLFMQNFEELPVEDPYRLANVFQNPAIQTHIQIKDTKHINFSDVPFHTNLLLLQSAGAGKIDGERGVFIFTDYLTAFFDHHLLGADKGILNGPQADYPEVIYHVK